MNLEALKQLSKMCRDYLNSGKGSERQISETLLLNLFEVLGYHDELIVSPGAYDMDGGVSFQYALKDSNDENKLAKVYIKIIDFGEDLTAYEQDVHDTCLYQTHINDEKAYYVITNCYLYKVYLNTPDNTNVVNLRDLGNFNLAELTSLEMDLIRKLSLEDNDNLNYDIEEKDISKENMQNNKEEKSNNNKKFNLKEYFNLENKNILIKIGLIFAAIILILIVFKFLFEGTAQPSEAIDNNTSIDQSSNISQENNKSKPNKKTDTSSNLQSDYTNTVSYLNISAVLDLTVVNGNTLDIEMISNLEPNAIVKLGIFCGDNSQYLYAKTDKSGSFETSFTIPETWGNPNILVGAYLKFNEENYPQPDNVIIKYGKNGENIIWKEDYAKDMITYAETTHSNKLVEALLKEQEEQKRRELMNKIEKDFSEIDTRVDALGNIKHVPKGFSFDETNIDEKTHIYPMIFYDNEKKTSYFYVICGYVGTQFVRFEGVSLSADGYNWKYENSTNDKKNKISGNQKAEWVYFNQINNSALLNDMTLLANSKDTTMVLTGSINKKYSISADEKNRIKQFLYIYETYYGNGTFVPDTEWFSLNGTKVNLNYIIKPNEMRQRGYLEIDSLKKYANSLSEKRLNNETITTDEKELLNKMNLTYRKVSQTLLNKIYDSIIKSQAVSVYYDDYETNQKYFKIYFFYDKDGIIEDGYIPYINVYEDKSVIVPIKTVSTGTTKYDKVFAKYYISDSLYDELNQYFKATNYTQFDNRPSTY